MSQSASGHKEMCLQVRRGSCVPIEHTKDKEHKSPVFYTGVDKRVDPPQKIQSTGFEPAFTPKLTDRSSNTGATTKNTTHCALLMFPGVIKRVFTSVCSHYNIVF